MGKQAKRRKSPIKRCEIAVCNDCVQAIANDDYSGIDDAKKEVMRKMVHDLGWASVGEELGFSHNRCDCCGGLAGNRHVAYVEVRDDENLPNCF